MQLSLRSSYHAAHRPGYWILKKIVSMMSLIHDLKKLNSNCKIMLTNKMCGFFSGNKIKEIIQFVHYFCQYCKLMLTYKG